jgi:ribonuclease Z
VHDFVTLLRQVARYNLKFSLESVEMTGGSWVRFEGYTITAFFTKHGMPSLGYVLEEDPRPGRFNRDRAIELGVPPGPLFGRLQRGEVIRLGTGDESRGIHPDAVMGISRPGRKIVYTGDTKAVHMTIQEFAHDADLLIHDATYDESEAERGAEFFHATAAQAGEAAAELHARVLALIHTSSRYTDARDHINDAKKKFSGSIIAPDDLDMIEIAFRDEV